MKTSSTTTTTILVITIMALIVPVAMATSRPAPVKCTLAPDEPNRGFCCDKANNRTTAEAWSCLIGVLETHYAFGEWKGLEWTTIEDRGKDFIAAAAAATSAQEKESMLAAALHAAIGEIPDGHVSLTRAPGLPGVYKSNATGGFGFAFSHTGDGSACQTYEKGDACTTVVAVDENSAAYKGGVRVGMSILNIDSLTADETLASFGYGNRRPWLATQPHGVSTWRHRMTENCHEAGRATPGTVRAFRFVRGADKKTLDLQLTAYDDKTTGLKAANCPRFFPNAVGNWQYQQVLPKSGLGYLRVWSEVDEKGTEQGSWITDVLSMTQALKDTKGMVIDIRSNMGGEDHYASYINGLFLTEAEKWL